MEDGKHITTLATDNILKGFTRDTIMQLAREVMGLEVIERTIDRTELYVAGRGFLLRNRRTG